MLDVDGEVADDLEKSLVPLGGSSCQNKLARLSDLYNI